MDDRTRFIGASEISAVLGLNPWKTALQLWGEKTGLVPAKDLSTNEAVEWGTRLERVVSAKFAEKHDVKLIAYKKRYVHPAHSFISCELDNIIAGTDELVEIKTCNANAYKDWTDPNQIPQHYTIQVNTQLGLSGRTKGHIAVLCGGQRYFEKVVMFDQKLYDETIERTVAFWKMVEDRTPPEAVGEDNDTLLQFYPKAGELLEAVEQMNTSIALLQETKAHIKSLEEQKDGLEASLKQVIGENQGIKTSAYIVTWKEQSRAVVDTDALKRDGLYEGYTKESKTRVLRIAKNGGK